MQTIKIYYNGFRIGDSKELVKAYIGLCENGETISMYARDYGKLPSGYGFNIVNETDCMTDYFESDHARVGKDHPLFKFLRYAALKDEATFAKRMLKKGSKDQYGYEEKVAAFEAEKDPGQPKEEDLKALQDWMDEMAAKAKAEKEAKEAQEREAREASIFIEKLETEMTIYKWEDEFPMDESKAFVEIPFSERPGIVSGSKWSLKAAQHIFEDLDRREHAKHAGYDKTDFVIHWKDDAGEENTYRGRYDIGDGENGLLQHIFNFAEWYRVHDEFGHPLENPPQTTPNIELYQKILEQYNE